MNLDTQHGRKNEEQFHRGLSLPVPEANVEAAVTCLISQP